MVLGPLFWFLVSPPPHRGPRNRVRPELMVLSSYAVYCGLNSLLGVVSMPEHFRVASILFGAASVGSEGARSCVPGDLTLGSLRARLLSPRDRDHTYRVRPHCRGVSLGRCVLPRPHLCQGLRARRSRCSSASPYMTLGFVSGSRLLGKRRLCDSALPSIGPCSSALGSGVRPVFCVSLVPVVPVTCCKAPEEPRCLLKRCLPFGRTEASGVGYLSKARSGAAI
ncbi:hypothetical protein NDU88_002741 [Pleurodeles waltl]|uniref:Uncharacterized protein n=1 Tax=Pleurodeles waltl TaxID=8319 RepID=A0AAV7SFT5_PLEWA|nr:hypothetical protein NDU88_002741 [Pleurodeles waltl]